MPITAIVTGDGTATSVTIGTTTYAGDASASFEAAATVGYNTIVMSKVDSAQFEFCTGKNVIADQIRMIGNTVSYGGAISNSGTATIGGSTFSENLALYGGGAIYYTSEEGIPSSIITKDCYSLTAYDTIINKNNAKMIGESGG